MSTHWLSVFLLLTFDLLGTAAPVTESPKSHHLVTEATGGSTGDHDTSTVLRQDGGGGGGGAALPGSSPSAVTPVTLAVEVTATTLPTPTATTPRATPTITPKVTPRAISNTIPGMTPSATSNTTPRVIPSTTSRVIPGMNARAISRASPLMTPVATVRWGVDEAPNRTGTFVVLFLLLLLVVICLYGAWRKLEEFGGRGSYSPCQIDKHLYVNPEEGEGGDGQHKPVGQAFLAAVRNLLPWKLGRPQGVELEEEEEEAEEEGGQSGVGGSEGESEGGQEEGGPTSGDEQSDSDDYSSLGGLDLRERAARAEGGEGEGREEEEEDLSDPPSPRGGEELLSELHSFSGTATWTDTNHDVTVL
ncbi:uncharacterized protein LOC144487487 [Mustelus asterias]